VKSPIDFIKTPFLLFSSLFLVAGCFKEDKPMRLPLDSEAKVTRVFLGKSYENQLFYNLETGVVAERDINDWELAIDLFSSEYKVLTNYGRDIFVARTSLFTLNELATLKPASLTWNYDFPNGKIDSNAIGDWKQRYGADTSAYFLLDLGRFQPIEQRYFFFRFINKTETEITIQFGNQQQIAAVSSLTIQRDANRNYAYVSIRNKQVLNDFEPLAKDWDLIFTRYRHIFYIDPNPTDPFPYLVTGALLNPRFTAVAMDTIQGFANIDLPMASSLSYDNTPDIIGYAWKNFDFTVSFTYSVNPNTTYIIRSTKSGTSKYYKIRFLDFYNENKEKGYPKFEVKPILF
jgi:hypothetical protein